MSNYVVGLMKSIPAGAVALALLFAGPAQAGPRNPALVAHNGSLMSVRTVGRELMEIRYVEPRPSLWPLGVRPGTLLIRGQWDGPMLYATAVVFAGECDPFRYAVNGQVDRNGVLVLRGAAPIVDPNSCDIYVDNNEPGKQSAKGTYVEPQAVRQVRMQAYGYPAMVKLLASAGQASPFRRFSRGVDLISFQAPDGEQQ